VSIAGDSRDALRLVDAPISSCFWHTIGQTSCNMITRRGAVYLETHCNMLNLFDFVDRTKFRLKVVY